VVGRIRDERIASLSNEHRTTSIAKLLNFAKTDPELIRLNHAGSHVTTDVIRKVIKHRPVQASGQKSAVASPPAPRGTRYLSALSYARGIAPLESLLRGIACVPPSMNEGPVATA
jgi:hypothetical protein